MQFGLVDIMTPRLFEVKGGFKVEVFFPCFLIETVVKFV